MTCRQEILKCKGLRLLDTRIINRRSSRGRERRRLYLDLLKVRGRGLYLVLETSGGGSYVNGMYISRREAQEHLDSGGTVPLRELTPEVSAVLQATGAL